MKMTRL